MVMVYIVKENGKISVKTGEWLTSSLISNATSILKNWKGVLQQLHIVNET